ncbi:MAG TPA: hypothetical protein VM597_19455 [Gemmataceae bacterium]|jgi:hypothetical protein|nr:hypothetical protein [Gemmataceae bacterium]
MSGTESDPDADRKAVFAAVVMAQDDGFSVEKARSLVARRFGMTESDVKAIEREGLNKVWPPLGDA